MARQTFVLRIRTSNAAFRDEVTGLESAEEVARILRRVAADVETEPAAPVTGQRVRDVNGNTVGEWTWTR